MTDEEIETTIKELEATIKEVSPSASGAGQEAYEQSMSLIRALWNERNKYRFLLEREMRRTAEFLQNT